MCSASATAEVTLLHSQQKSKRKADLSEHARVWHGTAELQARFCCPLQPAVLGDCLRCHVGSDSPDKKCRKNRLWKGSCNHSEIQAQLLFFSVEETRLGTVSSCVEAIYKSLYLLEIYIVQNKRNCILRCRLWYIYICCLCYLFLLVVFYTMAITGST